MQAAAHTPGGYGGVPQAVGKEFTDSDFRAIGIAALDELFPQAPRAEPKKCAGILFRAPGPLYLLVNRSDNSVWEQPGGHVETGETLEQAAVRECIEELGVCPDGIRTALRVSGTDGIEYTCFLQNVRAPFHVKLNHENIASIWTDGTKMPGIHPEVAKTISLLTGNELDMAKRIQSGELLSPQHYENIWLFDVRVTGTGTSYRTALDEYVYRPPEEFLTDEFVERCNGLPVIFEHPKKTILNTVEYSDRAIGNIILPYIKGSEVWGIAKIYDDDAAKLMATTHITTSPAVVFRDAGSTETINLSGGQSVLIEGKPSYLDHLAICEAGVWDKGGEPTGINIGGSIMAGEDKLGEFMDALSKRFDSLDARMDSIEKGGKEAALIADKARKDAEEKELADKARKDASESEEEKSKREADEKADKARKDEEDGEKEKAEEKADSAKVIAGMAAQIAALNAKLQPLSNDDRDALSAAQARADSLAQMYGDSVTAPLHGESPLAYRKRLVEKFKKHSAEFKETRLDSIEGPAFDLIEDRIYADAATASMASSNIKEGQLIPVVTRDQSGRMITEYRGDIEGFLRPFKAPAVKANFVRSIQ